MLGMWIPLVAITVPTVYSHKFKCPQVYWLWRDCHLQAGPMPALSLWLVLETTDSLLTRTKPFPAVAITRPVSLVPAWAEPSLLDTQRLNHSPFPCDSCYFPGLVDSASAPGFSTTPDSFLQVSGLLLVLQASLIGTYLTFQSLGAKQ